MFIIEDTHTSDQNGYDVLPDKSNSTKKLIDNIELHKDKCKNIVDNISHIEHYCILDGCSETTIIYKK